MFIALILLSANLVFAQKNRCDLKVQVSESENGAMIIEADITVRNLKTNESFSSKGQIADFVFLNLPETDYEMTTKRENYKQSVNKFSLNCKNLDENGYSYFYVALEAGDSKEKIETDHRVASLPKFGRVIVSKDVDQEFIKKIQEERLKKFQKINNILNSEATYLEKPKFPKAAQAVQASGIVYVKITIDKNGDVGSAEAVSGHPLLRFAAVEAARKAKFNPKAIEDKSVKPNGFLIYNFTL